MAIKEIDKNLIDVADDPAKPSAVRLTNGTSFYNATTPSDTQPVSATNLDVRDLTHVSDSVTIGDGSNTATVRNLASNDALNVAIVDGAGSQITSFGGGTQYTEGDTDASISGTAMLMEGAADTLVPAQGTVADGLLVNLGTNNDVRLTDGTNIASVRDTGGSDSLNVAIVDASGNQITTFGGGTQYTEGDTDASITGTALMLEGAANALVAAPGTAADGMLVNLGANNDVTVTGTVTANPTYPSSSSVTQVASSATNVTLKASNASRRGLFVFNDSTEYLYLKFGATASTTSFTVKIPAQGFYEAPQINYTGIVDGIWSAANGNAYVTEVS